MGGSTELRRSSRHVVRPVEFWNFERREDGGGQKIIYNESDLSRCSVFEPLSYKFKFDTKTKKNGSLSSVPYESSTRRKPKDMSSQRCRAKKVSHSLPLGRPPEADGDGPEEVSRIARSLLNKEIIGADSAACKVPSNKRNLKAEESVSLRTATSQSGELCVVLFFIYGYS